MSDINGIEIHDILGLSKPLTKLIETVSCGIGKAYEPMHQRRMARAKAFEIEQVSEAVLNNLALPVHYDDGNVVLDSSDVNNLLERVKNRLLFQEMKKQINIDNIVDIAYQELENKDTVCDEPVDSDWISSFFDSVANISEEKMQILWGKVLAGEVESPGKFSLRTLRVLKTLTKKEAEMFETIVPFLLKCPGDKSKSYYDNFLLASNDDIYGKYGIEFSYIMILNEVGLISNNSSVAAGFILAPSESERITNNTKAILFSNQGDKSARFNHAAYMLTEAGKELLTIVSSRFDKEVEASYMQDCLEAAMGLKEISDIFNANLENVSMSIIDI